MNTDYLPMGYHLVETYAPPAAEEEVRKAVSELLDKAISLSSSATELPANLAESLRSEAVRLYLKEPLLNSSESLTDPVMLMLEKAHSLRKSLPFSDYVMG